MNDSGHYQRCALSALVLLWSLAAFSGLANNSHKPLALLLALAVSGAAYALAGLLIRRGRVYAWLHEGQGLPAAVIRLALALYLLAVACWGLAWTVSLWQAWAGSEGAAWLYGLLLSAAASFGLWRGSRGVLRTAVLTVAALPLVAIADTLLLGGQFHFEHLALARLSGPALAADGGALAGVLLAAWPMLLWYIPPGRRKGELALGFAVAGGYLAIEALRDLLVLGPLLGYDRFPLLRTLTMVKLGVGLDRVEFVAVLVIMAVALTGASALACAAGELASVGRRRPGPYRAAAAILLALGTIILSGRLTG